MTGFGSANFRDAKVDIEVSLKAVNSRYLEVRFHMPREYAPIESELKKMIQAHLKRGTVDIYVRRRIKEAGQEIKISTNKKLAKAWLAAYVDLEKSLKLPKKSISALDVARQAGSVFSTEEKSTLSESEEKSFLNTVKKAVQKCDKERAREGVALKKDLTAQLKELSAFADKIFKMRNQVNKGLEKRLNERIEKLGLNEKIEPARLAQEIVIMVDKSDISEEFTRLKEHIRNFSNLMKIKTPQGKKLDFYCQELLREVNTIGSKTQVAQMTNAVVEAKSTVERIREQVQNLE